MDGNIQVSVVPYLSFTAALIDRGWVTEFLLPDPRNFGSGRPWTPIP